MKRFVFTFMLIFSVFCIKAQKNIFVLVDVSKSVKQDQLDNAKEVLREIFTTGNATNGNVVGGNSADLQFYKLQPNDKVAVCAFGVLMTSANIFPNLKTIHNPANDVDNVLNSISWYPRDSWTYLTLARAKVAEFAKRNKINNYILIEITDNINDDYGPNGSPGYKGNTYLEDLCLQYNTTNNKVSDNGWIKVLFGSDKKFNLALTSGVNISTYTPAKFQPVNDGISITYPYLTKKGAEAEMNNESFYLTWACKKCKPDLLYSVFIEGYDGNSYTEQIDTIQTDSIKLKLTQNGMYQIIVSASDCNLIPDTAFIKLNVIKDTKIKITSPAGTKKKPNEVKSENVNVSWLCSDCDENTTYTVNLVGTDGNKEKMKPLKVKNFSANFNGVPSGKYRVTVSGDKGASSDTSYIVVDAGGGAGWLFVLLLLAGLGAGGYFLLKNLKNKSIINSISYCFFNY
jgi:hypothetical protein